MQTNISGRFIPALVSAILLTATTAFAADPVETQRLAVQTSAELASTTLGFHGWHHHRYGYGYGYGYSPYGYGYARPSLYYNSYGACCGGGYAAYYRPYVYSGYARPPYYQPYVYGGYARPPYYQPYVYSRPYYTTGYYSPYGSVYALPYSAAYRPYYTYPRAYSYYGYAAYPSYYAFAYPYRYGGMYYGF